MSPRMDKMLAIAFTLPVFLGGCRSTMDPYGRTVISTPTLGQALGVVRRLPGEPRPPYTTSVAVTGAVQEQRIVAGRTVQIVRAGGGHQIVVDGRVIISDNEDDRVLIHGVYQGSGRVYVLIAEQSGGTACPSMYQALDLSASAVAASPQFGICSDIPRVSLNGGTLRVSIPAFRAAPAATVVFRDGRLTE